ncbi:MAG: UDP-N-acetylmuramate--L-alanine ligase [Rickettsiaceae bacterium]|nr:UDP-N-acetylmuramate--L-alanine ligase [Rickettsiaceae bacterium]
MHFLERKKQVGALGTIHFVGIGGIGMSGIAEVMYGMGYSVQGSDISKNANTDRLSSKGVKIFEGHSASNIINADYVVISSAVRNDNPEVVEAIKMSIPVLKRSEMLTELMRFKTAVAISGSHGKTTTTSLVACLFEAAGLAPTVINGGIINHKSTNAYIGQGDYVIVEADESDGTFIRIPSSIAVITNIDPEHMDYYHSFDNLLAAFSTFITNLPFYGFAALCVDHPVVRDLASKITTRKIITYGIDSKDANVTAFNIRGDVSSSSFDVKISLPSSVGSVVVENITLPTPGRHNVLNALAAIAIAAEMDFGVRVIKDGFKRFNGVKRRFTKVGEYKKVSIIDDYAHHPAEIEATINTAVDVLKSSGGKLVAVFQPHRYSRLHNLFDDFSKVFGGASKLFVLDVYSAGEPEIEGVNSRSLVKKISETHKDAHFVECSDALPKLILDGVKENDIVLMMGAGSITYLAASLAEKLREADL